MIAHAFNIVASSAGPPLIDAEKLFRQPEPPQCVSFSAARSIKATTSGRLIAPFVWGGATAQFVECCRRLGITKIECVWYVWLIEAPMSKSADSNDKHVGNRIRMRRLMLNMSQTTLAQALGISFSATSEVREGHQSGQR